MFLTDSLQVATSRMCACGEGTGKATTGPRSVPELLPVQVQASGEKFLLEMIDGPRRKHIHIGEERCHTNLQD